MNRTFAQNVVSGRYKINYTKPFFTEVYDTLNGPYTLNIVLNIKGGIGRQTGIFKSSLGCQIALELDPQFCIDKNLAFTYNELDDKVKKYGKERKNQVFVLDEQMRDLKQSAILRLCNIIDSCRERGMSFIVMGVPEILGVRTFSDYQLERFGESNNTHLPKKSIYYAVRKTADSGRFYLGYIRWNVTPLTDKKWGEFWDKYMVRKIEHQHNVMEGHASGFNFENHAKELMARDEFMQKIISDVGKLKRPVLKFEVYREFPDVTKDERNMIYNYIVEAFNSQQNDD